MLVFDVFSITSYPKDNSNQMSKICPTCTSVCDLCQNNLYWQQDSRFGLYNVALIQGTYTFKHAHVNTHKKMHIVFLKYVNEFYVSINKVKLIIY